MCTSQTCSRESRGLKSVEHEHSRQKVWVHHLNEAANESCIFLLSEHSCLPGMKQINRYSHSEAWMVPDGSWLWGSSGTDRVSTVRKKKKWHEGHRWDLNWKVLLDYGGGVRNPLFSLTTDGSLKPNIVINSSGSCAWKILVRCLLDPLKYK
jgi:hypothetical protein